MEASIQYSRSWLCPEPGDRDRLLDMTIRLRRARALAMGFIGVGLLAAAPWVGWAPLMIAAGLAAVWQLVEKRVTTARKPEWLLAGGWMLSVGSIATGILLTGGAHSPAKSWLAIPALTLPARFTGGTAR